MIIELGELPGWFLRGLVLFLMEDCFRVGVDGGLERGYILFLEMMV